MVRYKLGDTTIRKILGYAKLERHCANRTSPSFLLSNTELDEIILYYGQSWETGKMDYAQLREEL